MTTKFEQEPRNIQKPYEKVNAKDNKNGDRQDDKSVLPEVIHNAVQQSSSPRPLSWQRLSLKTKATAFAIALSTIPVLTLGAIAYNLTNRNITESVTQQQQARVILLANQLERFTQERYRDIQNLSQLTILNNPSVQAATSDLEKQAVLNEYLKNNSSYDSIAVTDLSGNVILQSVGSVISNYSNIDYFQEVKRTNRPVITPPRKSLATGEYSIFVAAPVVDIVTGETIGMVRSRTPVKYLNNVFHAQSKTLTENIKGFGTEDYLVFNNLRKVFVAPPLQAEYLGKDIQAVFPQAAQVKAPVGSVVDINQIDRREYLVSYTALKSGELPQLNWTTLIAQPTADVFAARRELLLAFTVGTGLTALLVSLIAALLVNRGLRPVLKATSAVQKIGQGQLNTRIAVEGEDEIAGLGSNINRMANQLQTLLRKQEDFADQIQLFTDTTLSIRRSLNMEDILKTAVKEVRRVFRTDRVVIYCFDARWRGTIVAESVGSGWSQALDEEIDDPCFQERYVKQYRDGRVRAIDNIYQAGLTACHIEQLEQFEVKANLVAPILKDSQLLGLLISHQCNSPRIWQQSEIDLFTQLATQVGFAIDQSILLEQVEKSRSRAELMSQEQRQQKEALQSQLIELLSDVEEVSRGNLTVRAEVTTGEIGTVADFFNAIVESLRQIVTSVKKTAAQVNVSVGKNEGAMRHLADEALNQAEKIIRTLDSVEQMTVSIQAVADNARLATEVASTASATAELGGSAMDRTVQSILKLRCTIAETANKVKHLGESSQEISKVVSLINQIAMQTNVLAINASIEAARAGEEGRGFAIVAEEVGQLAAQSSEATKEIEKIVENIQLETSVVVKAMELGNSQVIEGTHLVEETKRSLEQIVDVSRQIDALVLSISTATVSQAQTSQAVTDLMKEIAQASEKTSDSSRQISGSLQQTVEIAQQLQVSVDKFEVGAD